MQMFCKFKKKNQQKQANKQTKHTFQITIYGLLQGKGRKQQQQQQNTLFFTYHFLDKQLPILFKKQHVFLGVMASHRTSKFQLQSIDFFYLQKSQDVTLN